MLDHITVVTRWGKRSLLCYVPKLIQVATEIDFSVTVMGEMPTPILHACILKYILCDNCVNVHSMQLRLVVILCNKIQQLSFLLVHQRGR